MSGSAGEAAETGDSREGDRRAATIAVVVATHERPERLERLLAALRAQERAPDEVVIVDDGSGRATVAVLDAESARGELPLRVLRRDVAGGPASAREDGWRAASSEVIAFTDDDCAPAPGWLAAVERAIAPGAFVEGRTLPQPEEEAELGPFSHSIWVRELDLSFPTCNMAYPRELLERIDGFDTETFGREPGGEDCDLAWRAIEAGAEPRFAPEALVHHAVDDLGPLGKLRLAARWTRPMRGYARHPRLREQSFTHGIFWKDIHWLLFRAAVGMALPNRHYMVRNWLVYPYAQDVWARGRLQGGGPALAPYYVLHDLVEMAAVARAAVKTRTLML